MRERLELRHIEHLMEVCGDSHDALMLLGTMAVVAAVIRQRDAAEARAAELEAAANAGYMHWIGIPYTELERRIRDVEDGKTIPHDVVMQRIRESWGAT